MVVIRPLYQGTQVQALSGKPDLYPAFRGRCAADNAVLTSTPKRVMDEEANRELCILLNESTSQGMRIGADRNIGSGVGYYLGPGAAVALDGCQGEVWAVTDSAVTNQLSMLKEIKVFR